ncbi:hypothetical protein XENOCAPTIV_028414 [Xenoophorus captivus]|uniref:Uncharacterized protein n=1 Tax=Xenoophorus captivus TaxID=1517983 RepID=A0ABV0RVG0_9TELE
MNVNILLGDVVALAAYPGSGRSMEGCRGSISVHGLCVRMDLAGDHTGLIYRPHQSSVVVSYSRAMILERFRKSPRFSKCRVQDNFTEGPVNWTIYDTGMDKNIRSSARTLKWIHQSVTYPLSTMGLSMQIFASCHQQENYQGQQQTLAQPDDLSRSCRFDDLLTWTFIFSSPHRCSLGFKMRLCAGRSVPADHSHQQEIRRGARLKEKLLLCEEKQPLVSFHRSL